MESLAIELVKRATNLLVGILGDEHRAEIETATKQLEADLEILLLEQRLRLDSFRDLLSERNQLYREVWQEVDLVSYEQWEETKAERILGLRRVEELREYLIKLNREKGFLLDATSRGFLLDLRTVSKDCISQAHERRNSDVHWIYPDEEPDYSHGIMLWMNKSALRRAMVRAMMLPESGDPKYFNVNTQRTIREEVKSTVMSDQRRFIDHGAANEQRRLLIEKVFDHWIEKEKGKEGN